MYIGGIKMEDTVVKNALSYSLASDLHNEWCRQELQAYFARAQQHAPNFKYLSIISTLPV